MRILLASRIDADAIERLGRDHDVECAFEVEDLTPLVAGRDVLVFRSGVHISPELLERGGQLRLLVRAGSGLDNVDLAAARRRGIRVARIPGPSADAVAELTFALMLALARNVCVADRLLRAGHWPKKDLGGPLLVGKTLGIIGAGNIGGRVGEIGAAWGMHPIGCVAGPNPRIAEDLSRRGIRLRDFDTVLEQADFLTLHVPLDAGTRGLIGAPELARMRRGSCLINLARGGVVDEAALLRELTSRERLIGAALDVHEREGEGTLSPLCGLDNVVLTPHIGGMATDSQRQIGERVIELVNSFAEGEMDRCAGAGELVA